ncbi:MAG: flavodoxin family protein [Alphaproteobacteria bacterium]
MKHLLIVAHAPSPNTVRLRDAAVDGASHADISGVDLRVKAPLSADADDVRWADGILLGTTENLGYMAGATKDFFDRVYYPVLEEKQGLPFGLYIRAGQDGTGTKRAITSIVTGLRWKAVAPPLVCRGDWQDRFVDDVRDLGTLMAAGLEASVF